MEKPNNFINDYRDTFNNAPLVSINDNMAKSVFDKYSANGFIIVSPCESCENNELNIERIRDMISQIKSLKYAYMPVYALMETDKEDYMYEKSFVIFNCIHHFNKNNEVGDLHKLFEFGVEMAEKYNQTTFMFQEPDGKPKIFKKDGTFESECDGVEFSDFTKKYWNDLHHNTMKCKDDEYAFMGCYVNPRPQSLSERMSRDAHGEVFI
jgi:hypothetical protein